MATLEKAFEVAVVISAVDHLTPAMFKANDSLKLAQKNLDVTTKALKTMGATSGEIGKVTSQLKNLEKSQALAKLNKDLKDAGVNNYYINQITQGFEKLTQQQAKLDKLSASYDKFKKTALAGAGTTAVGVGMADGLVKALEMSGEFQTKLTVIQDTTGATTKQMNDLGNAIMDVSTKVTKFNDLQLSGFAQQLSSGGFSNVKDVQSLLLPVSQFAEAQAYEGKQTDPTEAVKQAIEMAHTFQHYDPKSFSGFLDTFNKYSNMQPGSSSDLYQTLQYLAPVASRQMKMKESDVMALAALDNRIGLTGSHGGTNAADMILRLIPGLIGGTTPKVDKQTGAVTYPKALQAMMDLGLADSKGNSKFFKNGQITDLGSMLQTLVSATKGKSPEKTTQDYKDIFGIQGGRAASLLADPTSIEQMQGMANQLKKTKSMEQIQQDMNQTPEGQLNMLKSNAMTALLRFAQAITPMLNPVLDKMNKLLATVVEFEKQHPGLMKVVGVFAVMATGVALVVGPLLTLVGLLGMASTGLVALGVKGGLGTVIKGVGSGIAAPFKLGGKAIGATGRGIATGAKVAGGAISSASVTVFKAIGSAATSAGSAIARFGSVAAKATGQALLAVGRLGVSVAKFAIQLAAQAIRMAASWLIAMGPVGWIIAGVTAIIIAAIAMWKTNFLGFRDALTAVWNWMSNNAKNVWKGIVDYIKWEIDTLKKLPGDMLKLGEDIINGLVNGIKNMAGTVGNVISGIGHGISNTFKSILGIHSPSKVFMEHGHFIAQGLAMGMTNSSHLVNNAVSGLASTADDGMGYALSGGSRSGSSVSHNYNDNYNFNITINQQPGQDAKSLAKDVYQEIGRLLRNDGRRSGIKPRNAW